MRKYIEKYLGNEVPFDERLFYLATFLSAAFSFLFIMLGLLLTIEPIYYLAFGSICVLSCALFALNARFHVCRRLTHILLFYCNFVIFPHMMIKSHKNYLEVPVYFIIGLVFSVLLLKGLERILFFSAMLIVDLVTVLYCFVIRYEFDVVLGATNRIEYIRVIIAIIDVFILCGIIVTFRNHIITSGIKEAMEAREKAEKTSYAKDMFLVNVSHEIRTPLNAILGATEIMLDSDCNNLVKEMAYNISNSGQALLSVTSDLLDFSRMDIAENSTPVCDMYDVSNLLNDVINQISIKMADSIVDFHATINPSLPKYLYGDSVKIRQIILNMLSNAIKYTESGYVSLDVDFNKKDDNTVDLTVAVSDTGMGIMPEAIDFMFLPYDKLGSANEVATEGNGLGLSLSQEFAKAMGGIITVKSKIGSGSTLTFSFSQGIDEKALDNYVGKVFDNKQNVCFYCFSMSEGAKIENSLDLMGIQYYHSMATAEFVEKCSNNEFSYYMLDSMTYENLKDKLIESSVDWRRVVIICDTNYSYSQEPFENALTRPVNCLNLSDFLNKTRNFSVRIQHFEGHFSIPGATVLVVDDNLVNLEVASTLLSRYYPRVITATSGKEGLIALRNEHVDIVFLDYMMPEMDGTDTLRAIRAMEDGRFLSLPVVCLTANAVSGAKELFLEQGFNEYLSKPIEVDKLERTLLDLLPSELIKYKL